MADVRPDEVSAILREQLSNFKVKENLTLFQNQKKKLDRTQNPTFKFGTHAIVTIRLVRLRELERMFVRASRTILLIWRAI